MEFKGTPAPWGSVDGLIYGVDGAIVAEAHGHVADDNLIAAAPELLEALIEIRKLVAHHDKADLAIAKALSQQ